MLDVELTAWSNDESNVAHQTYTQYHNMIYLTCSGRSKQWNRSSNLFHCVQYEATLNGAVIPSLSPKNATFSGWYKMPSTFIYCHLSLEVQGPTLQSLRDLGNIPYIKIVLLHTKTFDCDTGYLPIYFTRIQFSEHDAHLNIPIFPSTYLVETHRNHGTFSAAVLFPRAKKQRTSKIFRAQGFHLGGWRLHHDPCTLSRCSKSTRGTAQTTAIQLCSLEVDVFWLLFDDVIFHSRFGGCFLRTFAVVVTMEYNWDDFANTKVKLMDSKRIHTK